MKSTSQHVHNPNTEPNAVQVQPRARDKLAGECRLDTTIEEERKMLPTIKDAITDKNIKSANIKLNRKQKNNVIQYQFVNL